MSVEHFEKKIKYLTLAAASLGRDWLGVHRTSGGARALEAIIADKSQTTRDKVQALAIRNMITVLNVAPAATAYANS